MTGKQKDEESLGQEAQRGRYSSVIIEEPQTPPIPSGQRFSSQTRASAMIAIKDLEVEFIFTHVFSINCKL